MTHPLFCAARSRGRCGSGGPAEGGAAEIGTTKSTHALLRFSFELPCRVTDARTVSGSLQAGSGDDRGFASGTTRFHAQIRNANALFSQPRRQAHRRRRNVFSRSGRFSKNSFARAGNAFFHTGNPRISTGMVSARMGPSLCLAEDARNASCRLKDSATMRRVSTADRRPAVLSHRRRAARGGVLA